MTNFTPEQMAKILDEAERTAVYRATDLYRYNSPKWYEEFHRIKTKELLLMTTPPRRRCERCGK